MYCIRSSPEPIFILTCDLFLLCELVIVMHQSGILRRSVAKPREVAKLQMSFWSVLQAHPPPGVPFRVFRAYELMVKSMAQTGCFAGLGLLYFLAPALPDSMLFKLVYPSKGSRNAMAGLFLHDFLMDMFIRLMARFVFMGPEWYHSLQANLFYRPWSGRCRMIFVSVRSFCWNCYFLAVGGWYLKAARLNQYSETPSDYQAKGFW